MGSFYKMSSVDFDSKSFVQEYKTGYFLDEKSSVYIHSKSSHYIEDEVVRILTNGIRSTDDVKKIVAWKIGKIKHRESQQKEEFVYASDWENGFDVKRYNEKIEKFGEFASLLVENYDSMKEKSKDNPSDVLEWLKKEAPAGLGSVYLITLLFFISGGEYPIYDQYADKALIAIKNNNMPGDKVNYHSLPGRETKKFSQIFDGQYGEYINNLKELFSDEYKSNRDIDRALWVYGHLFK